MATYGNKMNVRNQMSATALKASEKDNIRFIKNPKTGKLFFTCGTKIGYISPAVQAKATEVTLNDLNYAECCIEGQDNWIPVLMMRNNSNVVAEI